MDLANASAIVTGGFGCATVRRLVQMGAKVVIADVSDERGEALAREVGAGSVYVPTDCIDEDAIAEAVKAAARRPRAAVCRRGHPYWPGLAWRPRARTDAGSRSGSTPPGQVRTRHQRVSRLRLRRDQPGAEEMAKNEPLASNQRGVIINTASSVGFKGQPGQAAYSAAKGGIIGMTLTIARDLAKRCIRVMAITPGPFFRGTVRPRARTAGSPASPSRSRFRRVVGLSLLLDGPVWSLWRLRGPGVCAFHQ